MLIGDGFLMKKLSLFLVTFAILTYATVLWTVKAESGGYTTNSGVVAINIGDYFPTTPTPARAVWESCTNGWIYFNKKSNGSAVEEQYVDWLI